MLNEPGQERRAFIAILMAMGVLFLWSVVFPPAKREPVETDIAHSDEEGVPAAETPGASDTLALVGGSPYERRDDQLRQQLRPTEELSGAGESLLGVGTETAADLRQEGGSGTGAPVQVIAEGEDLTLEITGRGARVTRATLHAYDGPDGEAVNLVPGGGAGAVGSVVVLGEREIALDQFVFQLVEDSGAYGDQPRRLVWELGLDEITLRKTFTIPHEGHVFSVEHELLRDDLGTTAWGLSWAGGLEVTENVKRSTRGSYFSASVFAEGKVQRKDPNNLRKETQDFQGLNYFVAVQNKYFVGAIVPRGDSQGPARLWYVPGRGPEGEGGVAGEILVDRSRGVAANLVAYDVYVGPLDYDGMAALELGIEGIVDLGFSWIRPLSRFVLRALIWLRSFIPNYGLVIIVFSTVTNIVFFPLTYKSTKSMRDMAALKPRIDALKEKYKDQPQKVSEATMRLYKEAGVNPLGGCLPLVLQMPIFFALYAVLFRTIELRGAPFIFWIDDLAQPDVVFDLPFALPMIGTGIALLPIIMGITSYFQAKQTTADPNQKMMTVIMPVVMTFIFFSFPSGLVLYWLTSNVLTILQKFLFRPSAAVVEAVENK